MCFNSVNGIKIRQLEVVKQYGFISVRSNYKEYSTFNHTLYCFISLWKSKKCKIAFQAKGEEAPPFLICNPTTGV